MCVRTVTDIEERYITSVGIWMGDGFASVRTTRVRMLADLESRNIADAKIWIAEGFASVRTMRAEWGPIPKLVCSM